MIKFDNISLQFGGVKVLQDININIEKGSLHAIIGPNGAGKTSLMNIFSGVYRPTSGSLLLEGKDLTQLKPHQIASLGVARVFQNVELFDNLTVLDNIMLGRHLLLDYGLMSAGLYFGKARKAEVEHRHRCEEIIDFLEMEEIRKQPVGILPFGMRKKVELARALAMEPKLLLLDEPVAGMNSEEKEDLVRYVMDIHAETDITIIMIEHDMQIIMDISEQVTVLNFGQVIASGTPDMVQSDQAVIDAYLGEGESYESIQ